MAALGAWGEAVTPSLGGRWQSRLFVLATIGVIVSAFFTFAFDDRGVDRAIFFYILGYVALFGAVWDLLFIGLQRLRWDRDWPAAFQVGAGVVEGIVLWLVIDSVGLPGIPEGGVPVLSRFLPHYGSVWLLSFLWLQGPMRVLSTNWRFNGGRLA